MFRNKKAKLYVTTGVTQPLVDGQTRQVTLVGIVNTRETYETVKNTKIQHLEGKKITTISEEEVLKCTRTTLSVGLAVLSPQDIEKDKENFAVWTKGGKAPADFIPIVTPQRGEEIAAGKASKAKSALYNVTTTDPFFTRDTINAILASKLKQIVNDPNRFIKLAAPKEPVAPQSAYPRVNTPSLAQKHGIQAVNKAKVSSVQNTPSVVEA
jgi:hypothetical protein